jgi:hypothetical protein
MTARNTRKKNIKIIVVIVKKYIFQESNRIILHHHCFLLCVFATTVPLLFMSSELPTTLVDSGVASPKWALYQNLLGGPFYPTTAKPQGG